VAAHKGPRAHGETKVDGKERPRRWLVVYRPCIARPDNIGLLGLLGQVELDFVFAKTRLADFLQVRA
jgi:hypothetical protein